MTKTIKKIADLNKLVINSNPLFYKYRNLSELGGFNLNEFERSIDSSLIKLHEGIAIYISKEHRVDKAIEIKKFGDGCILISIVLNSNRQILNTGKLDQDHNVYFSKLIGNASEHIIYQSNVISNGIIIIITNSGLTSLERAGAVSSNLLKYLQCNRYDKPIYGRKTYADPTLIFCAKQIVSVMNFQQINNVLMFSSKLHELLSLVIQNLELTMACSPSESTAPKFDIEEFRTFLLKLDYFDFTLDHLANMFNISVSSLHKQFRQKYDIAISQFIQNIKMTKANELIDNNTPTKIVAERLGYSSISSLGRAIKRYNKSDKTTNIIKH